MVGYGYPTGFFLPRRVNDKPVYSENRRFGWRFFGPALARTPYPTVLPAAKAPGTIRIFVFGGSAAYGDPQPDYGLPRMLRALLEHRYPETHFEVVNAAMVAINSNVVLPIARDCVGKQGDIWVIYMGNNEVVGPYGGGTVFGAQAPPLPIIRAVTAVKATRVGELLSQILGSIGAKENTPNEWTGTLLFVRHQVRADDPCMARVYSHFAKNLQDILNLGVVHHVKIVVSTVATNLKDCAPFGSQHRPGLSTGQLHHWEEQYQAGIKFEESGDPRGAIQQYAKAGELDNHFADLQFRWARCCLALEDRQEARRHFILARDFDTLRFRCDSRINDLIRQEASQRDGDGIECFDAAEEFARQSPDGVPGDNFFYEHVHLNFDGTYLLARNLADQVVRLLPKRVLKDPRSRDYWLSKAACARTLLWTDWDQNRALEALRLDVPPFTYRLNRAEQSRRLNRERKRLAAELTPEALRQIAREYRRAVAMRPGDWVLEEHLALLQQQTGEPVAAEKSWRRVIGLLPDEPEPRLQLGLLLSLQGRTEDASTQLATAFELDPASAGLAFVKALDSMGRTLSAQGKFETAIRLYQQALEFKPELAEVRIDLGKALRAEGKTDQAREQFRRALEHPPGTPQGLVALGQACSGEGWTDDAITCFQAALALDPANPSAQLSWGLALMKEGKDAEAAAHFQEALRLDPENTDARDGLDRIRGRIR